MILKEEYGIYKVLITDAPTEKFREFYIEENNNRTNNEYSVLENVIYRLLHEEMYTTYLKDDFEYGVDIIQLEALGD